MKICPSCRQTYSDENLNFCLTDGSFLTNVAADNEPKTVYMDQSRITNQTNQSNWGPQSSYQPPPAVWQDQQSIQQSPSNYPMRINSQSQTLATISLILGIIGLLSCCFGGIPLGAGAIVTGVIAMNQEKSDPTKYGGHGLAMGGIITGAVALALSIGFILFSLITS